MTDERADLLVRQAIGGNQDAMAWVGAQVDVTDDPMLLVMAALLARLTDVPTLLERAAAAASHRQDRQLVDFPGSYVVAWVASGAHVAGGGLIR